MLRRARLDGLERATVPFPERYVTAWRGAPEPGMSSEIVKGALQVWCHALLAHMCSGSCCLHKRPTRCTTGLDRDMALDWTLCREPW